LLHVYTVMFYIFLFILFYWCVLLIKRLYLSS
jgi:hypothetical protein